MPRSIAELRVAVDLAAKSTNPTVQSALDALVVVVAIDDKPGFDAAAKRRREHAFAFDDCHIRLWPSVSFRPSDDPLLIVAIAWRPDWKDGKRTGISQRLIAEVHRGRFADQLEAVTGGMA